MSTNKARNELKEQNHKAVTKQETSSDSEGCEVIYEEEYDASSNDDGSDSCGSDEEVEYVYEIEYVEESESDTSDSESKQNSDNDSSSDDGHKVEIVVTPPPDNEDFQPMPILMRQPSKLRKNVSFSTIHSVLTEDNDVLFIDEEDDIFK